MQSGIQEMKADRHAAWCQDIACRTASDKLSPCKTFGGVRGRGLRSNYCLSLSEIQLFFPFRLLLRHSDVWWLAGAASAIRLEACKGC